MNFYISPEMLLFFALLTSFALGSCITYLVLDYKSWRKKNEVNTNN